MSGTVRTHEEQDRDLTPRQGAVLKAVVDRYVTTATPVGSEALAKAEFVSVSSATIRNDFSALESAGLIYQPHTSAGRVPSDRGYRYFVQHFVTESSLSQQEQRTILHQFSQVEQDVDGWLKIATSALARVSGNAAVVSGVVTPEYRLRTFEFMPIDSTRALLVVITSDAGVIQHIWQVPLEDSSAFDLQDRARTVAAASADFNLDELREAAEAEESGRTFERLVRMEVAAVLETFHHRQWEIRFRDGLANILGQPEFLRAGSEEERQQRVIDLLTLLERGDVFRDLFPDVVRHGSLRILIGEESPHTLRQVAVVLCPYGSAERVVGVVGVVGPPRLNYGRVIGASRYVSGILAYLSQDLPPYQLTHEFAKVAS
ncbi:MAG: heat-inducible transcriptional repressor HrcA [Chloroflexi bacterium]|nr:heat-inducible transcriptional repressor HrcA [Chloroflexota bacterium]